MKTHNVYFMTSTGVVPTSQSVRDILVDVSGKMSDSSRKFKAHHGPDVNTPKKLLKRLRCTDRDWFLIYLPIHDDGFLVVTDDIVKLRFMKKLEACDSDNVLSGVILRNLLAEDTKNWKDEFA